MVTTDTPISVIRRVGGLEVVGDAPLVGQGVIRRVGGLEVIGAYPHRRILVIRRVGGLEERRVLVDFFLGVIRRVGGLEVISFWSKVSSSDMLPPNVHAESKYPR